MFFSKCPKGIPVKFTFIKFSGTTLPMCMWVIRGICPLEKIDIRPNSYVILHPQDYFIKPLSEMVWIIENTKFWKPYSVLPKTKRVSWKRCGGKN